jgi:dienelactone hydrolase
MPRLHTLLVLLLATTFSTAQDGPKDRRLEKAKDYNGYFPWTPPTDLKAWNARKEVVRRQVLVSQGLWPMPTKTPLNAVVHGKIERDGYTIEKVYFASLPGHYVCGNLYRPTGKSGKLPAVLSPHGHWANGRFYEGKDVDKQLKMGAEKTRESAQFPLQARCAQLARLGCVVFHYDMVGYADSHALTHREGFKDVDAELWLTNFMGLQTWNSVRSLDFLLSLPDVDPSRIGVTGASGGGTQTFMLCAIDDRPAAAFPAVMVSTAMQGGCTCENCSLLRVDTGNIELAALWAPKPLGMAAANDWTKDIEKKGLPELKTLYRLYKADDRVMAEAHVEFPHNYNQVSREIMYNFFNKHLALGQPGTIVEKPFVPVPPKELSVFDDSHPLPKDSGDALTVRRFFKDNAKKQLAAVSEPGKNSEFNTLVGSALQAMVVDTLPSPQQVAEVIESKLVKKQPDLIVRNYVLSRKGKGEAVKCQGMCTNKFAGHVVVWVHPDGVASLWKEDGTLVLEARKILDADAAIFALDCFTPKGGKMAVNSTFAGYTFGYNRSLLAERVHDILSALAMVRGHSSTQSMSLVGFGEAGPWALLARGLCTDQLRKTAIDLNRFRFENVTAMDDPMLLPGALRYGGLPSFARLAAAYPLLGYNADGTGCEDLSRIANNGLVRVERGGLSADAVVDWLLKN